jgi:putative transposase
MQVVEVVERVKNVIGLQHALRFFNISVATFRNWSLQSSTSCFESLTGACNRVFHNQLSRPEVLNMKELLCDTQYQFWPISSIALHALHNDILPLSLNTWYKYVNKFGLARQRPKSRRKKNAFSVRANQPHQIWHADITEFVTADRMKHYIYLVVDNFSRKILSWKIADSVKAEFRRATIEEALAKVNNDPQNITLITDGGPENKLKAFLESNPSIQQKIALVDVHYSNSLIEAHNKLIKYNYLYRMNVPDEHQLQKIFPTIVEDFNNRPHISLDGLTPNEAGQNHALDRNQLMIYVKNETHERKMYNQSHQCTHCNE